MRNGTQHPDQFEALQQIAKVTFNQPASGINTQRLHQQFSQRNVVGSSVFLIP